MKCSTTLIQVIFLLGSIVSPIVAVPPSEDNPYDTTWKNCGSNGGTSVLLVFLYQILTENSKRSVPLRERQGGIIGDVVTVRTQFPLTATTYLFHIMSTIMAHSMSTLATRL
jgi:hypothetical protein